MKNRKKNVKIREIIQNRGYPDGGSDPGGKAGKLSGGEADRKAVCYLYDKENSGEFYTMETHNRCLEEIKARGLKRKEDDWCFERYNCPRFTTPDEKGNVILDYGIAVEPGL